MKKIIAISGSYRRNGIIESLIDIMLNKIKEDEIEVKKIILKDQDIKYCTNCRKCTQVSGEERGQCIIKDDLESILDEIERADGIIIGSPMNFGSITAVTKAFKERLVCYGYWPWGTRGAPALRKRKSGKRAILLWSCVMPAFIANIITRISKELKEISDILGFKTVGILKVGFMGINEREAIPDKLRKKAERLAKKLII